MNLELLSAAVLIAVPCAAIMGYAIQRGATCTVAAVDELLGKRSARRLASLAEASLWVAGGLLLARMVMSLPALPAGYAIGPWTLAGAALLGFGAWVNGACVFGAIARFGSGEWAYALTPLGFYLGCLTVGAFGAPVAQRLPAGSPVLDLPAAAVLLFLVFAAWRAVGLLRRGPTMFAARLWAPHMATAVIGITFVIMLLAVGAWAYTDVLAELARGMSSSVPVRVLFFLALLGGAAWGGWTAGRWHPTLPGWRQVLRCTAGGALMAWGTLLIPGSNDGLILIGMPLLWPYAWLAFATMCATIAASMLLSRQFSHFGHGARRSGAAS
ncbi:MAG: YeeE/YedE family protein [Piscinibacter sp.]|nr:YeeE/YedE family protein [Piscinibacter sp.]